MSPIFNRSALGNKAERPRQEGGSRAAHSASCVAPIVSSKIDKSAAAAEAPSPLSKPNDQECVLIEGSITVSF